MKKVNHVRCSILRLRVYNKAYCFWFGGSKIKFQNWFWNISPYLMQVFLKVWFLPFCSSVFNKRKWKIPSFFFETTDSITTWYLGRQPRVDNSPHDSFFCLPTHSSSLNSKYVSSDDNRLNISLENLRKYPRTPVLSLSPVHI